MANKPTSGSSASASTPTTASSSASAGTSAGMSSSAGSSAGSTGAGRQDDVLAGNPILTLEQQLDQIASFISVHYKEVWDIISSPGDFSTEHEQQAPGEQRQLQEDAEQAVGRLNDIVTHTSQLVLGVGLDHSIPGVAFTSNGPDISTVDGNTAVFVPSNPTGRIAVSLHGGPGWHGSGQELEIFWRPTIAAIAELSGTTIIDVDYQLPLIRRRLSDDAQGNAVYSDHAEGTEGIIRDALAAVEAAEDVLSSIPSDTPPTDPTNESDSTVATHEEARGYDIVAFGSGTSAGIELAAQWNSERIVLQHPRLFQPSPENETWRSHDFRQAQVLVQKATRDTIAVDAEEIAHNLQDLGATTTVTEYLGYHVLATPAVQRECAQEAANFLQDGSVR